MNKIYLVDIFCIYFSNINFDSNDFMYELLGTYDKLDIDDKLKKKRIQLIVHQDRLPNIFFIGRNNESDIYENFLNNFYIFIKNKNLYEENLNKDLLFKQFLKLKNNIIIFSYHCNDSETNYDDFKNDCDNLLKNLKKLSESHIKEDKLLLLFIKNEFIEKLIILKSMYKFELENILSNQNFNILNTYLFYKIINKNRENAKKESINNKKKIINKNKETIIIEQEIDYIDEYINIIIENKYLEILINSMNYDEFKKSKYKKQEPYYIKYIESKFLILEKVIIFFLENYKIMKYLIEKKKLFEFNFYNLILLILNYFFYKNLSIEDLEKIKLISLENKYNLNSHISINYLLLLKYITLLKDIINIFISINKFKNNDIDENKYKLILILINKELEIIKSEEEYDSSQSIIEKILVINLPIFKKCSYLNLDSLFLTKYNYSNREKYRSNIIKSLRIPENIKELCKNNLEILSIYTLNYF